MSKEIDDQAPFFGDMGVGIATGSAQVKDGWGSESLVVVPSVENQPKQAEVLAKDSQNSLAVLGSEFRVKTGMDSQSQPMKQVTPNQGVNGHGEASKDPSSKTRGVLSAYQGAEVEVIFAEPGGGVAFGQDDGDEFQPIESQIEPSAPIFRSNPCGPEPLFVSEGVRANWKLVSESDNTTGVQLPGLVSIRAEVGVEGCSGPQDMPPVNKDQKVEVPNYRVREPSDLSPTSLVPVGFAEVKLGGEVKEQLALSSGSEFGRIRSFGRWPLFGTRGSRSKGKLSQHIRSTCPIFYELNPSLFCGSNSGKRIKGVVHRDLIPQLNEEEGGGVQPSSKVDDRDLTKTPTRPKFERERTCPLCRALVKAADLRSFGDGSTSLFFQLF
ncbi:hypothetical protein HHK36_033352 [Tetracentron sinense]|uniref:Uncharacterized protein n=1 Tax=Tetracentron sinense TaxID=13715 RepID=A0A834Y7Q3_TETSI|nr:hypothetical protein HHK36_033352 [Tetracentron sinense]